MTVVLQPGKRNPKEPPIVTRLDIAQMKVAFFATFLSGNFLMMKEPTIIPPVEKICCRYREIHEFENTHSFLAILFKSCLFFLYILHNVGKREDTLVWGSSTVPIEV